MKNLARGMLAIAFLWALGGVAPAQDQIRILVPVFSGEPGLGRTTSNLIRLQVSQTFQVAGTQTRGVMVFRESPLPERSHEAAESAGMRPGSLTHLVLWGQSYEYPDGVVVQSHLSTTPWLYEGRAQRPELWTIEIPAAPPIRIRSELPREVYEFPPVILSREAARHYQNMDSLIIYQDRTFRRPIGRFRDVFRAHAYYPDAVDLESGGVRGWVPLPHLLNERSEIVEFVGGYIRLLRGDWPGAEQLFSDALGRDGLTSEMRIDTHIFLGLIAEKRGRSGLSHFREAVALNQYDRWAATYLLMGWLAQASRAGVDRRQALATLREQLTEHAPLFPADSGWIAGMRRAADVLGGNTNP